MPRETEVQTDISVETTKGDKDKKNQNKKANIKAKTKSVPPKE